jgi:hypothetical protein
VSAHERERLSAWLDDELSPGERTEVEAHLSTCAECRGLLADMGAVDERTRDLPLEGPEGYFDAFPARLRARIEREAPPARARPARGGWRLPAWTWAAAAALVLAVVTPLTLTRLNKDGTPPAHPEPRARALHEDLGPSEATAPEKATAVPTALPALEEKDAETFEDESGPAPKAEAPRRQAATAPPAPAAPPTAPEPTLANEAEDLARFAQPPLSEEAPRAVASEVSPPGQRSPRADTGAPQAGESAEGRVAGATVAGRGAAALRAQAAPDESPRASGRAREEGLPGEAEAFARLAGQPAPGDAAGWRQRRAAWLAFAEAHPKGPRADEARVRAIEAGLEAWRVGGVRADLETSRGDAETYLARDDARQADRVRRDLESVQDD